MPSNLPRTVIDGVYARSGTVRSGLTAVAGFTRKSRLLAKADFDQVFSRSRRSADRFFTVLYRENRLGYPRLGLAIAKKRVRLAVDRNRLKRLIRESFRDIAPTLPGIDIVIMARDPAVTSNNEMVFASLTQHWQSLGSRAATRTPEQLH